MGSKPVQKVWIVCCHYRYLFKILTVFIALVSNVEIGEQFEYSIMKLLVEHGIECNASRSRYYLNNRLILVGDGGVDLFGNYKGMNFIMQLKYKSNRNVNASEIKNFNQTLLKQPNEVQGFFVTNKGYTKRAKNEVTNSKSRMILCNDENIVDSFFAKFKDFEQTKQNNIVNEYKIKNVELDGVNSLNLFGIDFKGKCKIGSINYKRYNPY